MEKIAVFVNDAEHARHILQPMLQGQAPMHWVIVACPPALTRHIGRFVSQSARRQWHARWGADLFAQLEPVLRQRAGSEVEKLLVTRPLVQVSQRLQARLGPLRLLDARQARVGRADEPIATGQPVEGGTTWALPVAAASGLTALLAMAD